ncbi:beta-1,4-galactosyltransferase 6-like [Patiria miniata]|uniref:Beta-1,4-galactosyltransferase n=1 Tax=Patiria miniata TaxID=46514 RepID=A0A914B2G5_PATMI|nr:beta-1,4-galactosyltransferase 6-like [Patiria miniata]
MMFSRRGIFRNLRYLLIFVAALSVTALLFTVGDIRNVFGRKSDYRSLGFHINGEPSIGAKHHGNNNSDSRQPSRMRTQIAVDVHELGLNQPLTKCLALKDIPHLVNDRPMNLTAGIPMHELERTIFPDHPERIRDVVSRGNRELLSLLYTAANSPQINGSLIMEGLASLQVRSGDYHYLPGGHWRPASCVPTWKVAIVVPYRNRTVQLSIFLRYMIPFLQKQQLEFAIYIVNQESDISFNRGMLLNVGFLEALNFSHWDCFVFHDVDHLPQSEFNPYGCVDLPRHFIGGADNRNYKVPYSTSFGGVNGFTTPQFWQINGFPNVYWGWCCEDDDLEVRVRTARLKKTRYAGTVGYYKAIRIHHDKIKKGLGELEKTNRVFLKTLRSRLKTDGLNNLKYDTPHLELHALYTNISVNIKHS